MILFPYEKIVLNTTLSSQQITERLGEAVDSSRPGWTWKWPQGFLRNSSKPFEGTIDGPNFKISRIINYHNSFLPVIVGKIEGSNVEIILRPSVFVIIFMVIWLAVVLGGFLFVLCHNWIAREPAGLMYLLGVLLLLIPFKIEARIANKKLKEILGVQ